MLKAVLSKLWPKLILLILGFFAPIQYVLFSVFIFCVLDFATGIAKAKRTKQPITSGRMQKKIWDCFFYSLAIIAAHIIELLFGQMLPVLKFVAATIMITEFWSNLENISAITGLPLTKLDFLKFIDKSRKHE